MTIEEVDIRYFESGENVYRVPKKQWAKWSRLSRFVFNEVYSSMADSMCLFQHPEADPIRAVHWDTTAWNAAWTAAEAVKRNDA